uniref:Uncharacterized protein n=1 Tax=Rhizophora mucronata TaxID=61149 RepID=A0A2P2JEV5_RHIMU
MASHFSHNHCQNTGHSPTAAASACCCSCSCCHRLSPSPPLLSVDQLLEYLVSILQQRQQQQHPPPFSPYSPFPNQPHAHHPNHHQDPNFRLQNLHFPHKNATHETQFVLSSLLQRISTLESSLNHLSPSSTTNNHYHPSYSLRDTAARVIQTHFRAFLVRRSRTLRQLKGLASIKSRFASLKSSVSGKTHFNFEVVSRKAMDLLLKLDSIQVMSFVGLYQYFGIFFMNCFFVMLFALLIRGLFV